MDPKFDAYYQWLGIPPEEQPPHLYRLLGLRLFESNPDVIEQAADRQMAHVRTHQGGRHSLLSQAMLNELAAAKLCLLNSKKKEMYDQELKQALLELKRNRQPPPVESPAPPAPPVQEPPDPPLLSAPKHRSASSPDILAPRPPQERRPPPEAPRRTAASISPVLVLAIGGLLLAVGVAVFVISRSGQSSGETTPDNPRIANHGQTGAAGHRPTSGGGSTNPSGSTPGGTSPGASGGGTTNSNTSTSSGGGASPTTGTTASPPPLPQEAVKSFDPAEGPLKLLPIIGPARDTVEGAWVLNEGQLASDPAQRSLLQIPVALPSEYSLEATVVRDKGTGALVIGLPVGGKLAAFTLFETDGPLAAICQIDGIPGGFTESAQRGQPPKPGDPFQLVCVVKASRVWVQLNGDIVVDWQPDPKALSLPGDVKPRSPELPFLATSSATYRFIALELKPAASDGPPLSTPPEPSGAQTQIATKLPIPNGEEFRSAERQIRQQYRVAKANARTPADKENLARTLLVAASESADSSALRYALLVEARDMAILAANAELVLQIIDETAEVFQLDAWRLKAEALAAVKTDELQNLGKLAISLSSAAALDEQFDPADKLVALADSAAAKTRNLELREEAREWRGELRRRRAMFEEARLARDKLKDAPDDPQANLTVGKYLCFARGEWKAGLEHLSRGADAPLARVATLELARQPLPAPEDDLALADAWWAYAKNDKSEFRTRLQGRAIDWYMDTLPKLDAPTARQVEQVLDDIFAEFPIAAPTPSRKGLKLWLRADAGVQHRGGAVHLWQDQSGHGSHARQDDPKFCPTLVTSALKRQPALRMQEGSAQCLITSLRDAATYEGLSVLFVCNSGEAKRASEIVLGNDGPDVVWQFGFRGDDLGYTNSQSLGRGVVAEPAKNYLASYIHTRRVGWTVNINGQDAAGNADIRFPVSPLNIVIGAYRANNANESPFGGDLAEILIYDRPLSRQEHRQVFMYLSQKYGLRLPPPPLAPPSTAAGAPPAP
jgi:hypothetical protein